MCYGLSAKVCKEAPRESCRDSQGEQKCSSRRELCYRESAAIVCRSAAECSKEFPMGVPHKKKNKKR